MTQIDRDRLRAQQTFVRRIVELRESRGWSQAGAAESCEISVNYLGKLERGESSNPTLTILIGFARGFDVSVAYLIGEM